MGIKAYIAAGLKAAEPRVTATSEIGWQGIGYADSLLPGTKVDWAAKAGDLWRNTAVMACLTWICDRIGEAALQAKMPNAEGELQPIPEHPLPILLRRPDAAWKMSELQLWRLTTISYLVNGNAYWVKLQNGARGTVGYRYVYHRRMRPVRERGSNELVDYYEYTVGAGKVMRYLPEQVVHFRNGRNPENEAEGFAPLRVAGREVYTDNQWATYEAAIAKNFGAVGVMLVPTDPSVEITKETSRDLKDIYRENFTGDNSGMPFVPTMPVKPERAGFSPEEMALNIVRRFPEARICALLKVRPTAVGLASGEGQRSYANVAADAEGSVESAILPLLRAYADDLEVQVLPDLGDPARGEVLEWDTTGIRALQADREVEAKRASLLYQSDLWTRAEGRVATGKKAAAEDEVYFSQSQPVGS